MSYRGVEEKICNSPEEWGILPDSRLRERTSPKREDQCFEIGNSGSLARARNGSLEREEDCWDCYPKRNGKFRTADSQVIVEKELGLRQYTSYICGAGFGVSKWFLTPSKKCVRKADVVVLQDRYDLLAERFLEMERKMEAGKFVERPQASTTVKESFTHPRNFIPIPEDTITVRGALGTFVAWPIHLIDVVPIMGKVSDDNSATSSPRIDEHAFNMAKVVKSKSKSNLESSREVAPEKTNFCAKLMNYVQKYLYDNFIPKSKKNVMFLSPHSNTLLTLINDIRKKDQVECVADILDKNKENANLFLAPLNTRQHWVLVFINQRRVLAQASLFSLKRENPANFKNSDLTLSLKRESHSLDRFQVGISRPGETILAQARILQYSPGFHPPRPLAKTMTKIAAIMSLTS
ncbi:hypothetical protein Lal_00039895 [Lupinus albus]|nr:hypothetical protein Lal_00039895 [Lupinus albus]